MIDNLVAFAIAEFIFSVSPGPAVFLVMSLALNRGFAAGAAAAVGVVGVNILFFGLSALGIAAAVVASPTLFTVIKYVGAAYLTYLAIQIFKDLRACNSGDSDSEKQTPTRTARSSSLFGNLTSGIAIQSTSIKNIMIFLAIIPQFVDPAYDIETQLLILCILSVLVELPVLLSYSLFSAKLAQRVNNLTLQRSLDAACGAVFLVIAGGIVFNTFHT